MLRRPLLAAGSALLAAALVLFGAVPAAAAQAGWADWEPLSGSSRDFTTTMQQQATGFPAAAMATDSVGGSAVGVQSGSSTFLAPQTPPGEKYGSSQGQPYLNLRPNGLSAAPPSTTTYTFERPTPAAGWTFVLGDVDADAVKVSATGADGSALTAAELGFQGTFNYCAAGVSPKPSCSGPGNDGTDLPTWDAATATLTGGGADTAGGSGWFEPTVPVATLTLVFSRTAGSPVYQTWFSALSYDISGTVTAPSDREEGITLRLVDGAGEVIAETQTDAEGNYTFPGYATYDDYRVEVVPPAGLVADGPESRDADLSEGDQTGVDFVLTEPAEETGSIAGTVTTEDGDPVPGAEITGTGPEGVEQSTMTGEDGGYLLDELPPGDYQVVVTPPDGYEPAGPVEADATIDEDGTDVTDVDFVLAETEVPGYEISGTVEDEAGDPIEDVDVELTGPGLDAPVTTLTDDEGGFVFTDVPPGSDYRITVDPPADAEVIGDPTVTVDVVDRDVSGIGFTLELAQPSPSPTPSEPTVSPSPEPSEPGESTDPDEAGDPDEELPQTGGPAILLPLVGVALVLAGAALIRRRRSHL